MRSSFAAAIAFVLVGLAHAAPAPFPKERRGTECAPVSLAGYLVGDRPVDGPTWVISRRADWESLAGKLGIKGPPPVNFQTHFVLVHIARGSAIASVEVDKQGSLRVYEEIACGPRPGQARLGEPAGPRYLARSFARSAVNTVNGVSVPR